MFFDDIAQLPALAEQSNTSVFVIPPEINLPFKNPLILEKHPDKKLIAVEQVREILALTGTKQQAGQYVVIRHAEQLGDAAGNALLKALEEPEPHLHFVLLTLEPYLLLPTILSRANLYYQRLTNPLTAQPAASPAVVTTAKQLLAATPTQLPALADQIAKHKDNTREYALSIVATAIELAYKSFFATKNPQFLRKITPLTELYQNLQAGGNLKLHIVADLC